MKELKKIDIKLYEKFYLTSKNFSYLWDEIQQSDILQLDRDKYLFVKTIKGTDYVYVFTIPEGTIKYHGITNWFIVDLLTTQQLQKVEYPEMLKKINETFGSTLSEAYTNKNHIF